MATTVTPPSVIKVQVGNQQAPTVTSLQGTMSIKGASDFILGNDVIDGSALSYNTSNGNFTLSPISAAAAYLVAQQAYTAAQQANATAQQANTTAQQANTIAQQAYITANNKYTNSNVAAYLPTYGGVVDAVEISNTGIVNIGSEGTIQLQYDPTGTYDIYDIKNGSWLYIDSSGLSWQSNTTGQWSTVSLDNVGNVSATGNVTAQNININGSGGGLTFPDNTVQVTAYTGGGSSVDQTARTQANAAYDQANSAIVTAQAAFDKANTGISSSIDQTARTQANTANLVAISAYAQANSATSVGQSGYAQANNAISLGQSAYTQANNAISLGQSAYGKANTATSIGQAAYAQVNTTQGFAQASFDTANTKFNSSGGTISGNVTIQNNLVVTGNLSVLGTSTTINTSSIVLNDPLLYLANNNYLSDAVDIGIIGHYNDGVNAHTGIFRDPARKEWIFFQGYTPEVESNNVINIADPSFAYANVYANRFKGTLTGNVIFSDGTTQNTASSPASYSISGYGQANSAITLGQSAYAQANTATNIGTSAYATTNSSITLGQTAYTQANAAYNQANSATTLGQSAYAQANNAITLGQSGYTQANSATTLGQSAYAQANAAYNQANSVTTLGQSAYAQANAAYNQANSAITLGQSAYARANSEIIGTAAYLQANLATTIGQSAYAQANTTQIFAQAAFDKANTGGGGTVSTSGYLPNSIIYANNTGYLSNVSTLEFFASNNTLVTTNLTLSGGAGGQITFSDGTTQTTAASGAATDQTARNLANSASSVGQSAYAQANNAITLGQSAYTQANTATLIGESAYIQANSATSVGQSGYAQANNAITLGQSAYRQANDAISLGQSAYTQANTSTLIGQSAYTQANNATTNSQSAYGQANSATTLGQTAYTQANAAYVQANSAYGLANAAFLRANSEIIGTAAYLQANAATSVGQSGYAQANDATTLGQTAYAQANAAYVQANSAYTQANSAFDQANNAITLGQSGYAQANAAYNRANNAYIQANNATIIAQAAFADSNTRLRKSGDTMTGNLLMAANIIPTISNTFYLGSKTKPWHSLYVGPGSLDVDGVILGNEGGSLSVTSNTGTSINLSFISDTTNTLVVYTNSAYYQANTATLIGESAYIQANDAISLGQSAYQQANDATTLGQSAYQQANDATSLGQSAYQQANDAISLGQSAYQQANDAISLGQSAYQQANDATTLGQSAYEQANSAYNQANTATLIGESAYATANLKFNTAGGTITGNVTVLSNLTISGNLTVIGSATTINTSSIVLNDPLLYLANNNFTSDAVDIGIIGHYNDGINAHTGIFRDPARKEWIFFQGYTPEVESNNIINIAHPSFAYANVYANRFKGNLVGSVTFSDGTTQNTAASPASYSTAAYNQANSAITLGQSAYSQANSSTSVGQSGYNQANNAITLGQSAYAQANSATSVGQSGYTQANSAYNQANSSTTLGQSAYAQANAAYTQANAATTTAQAAFNKANTETIGTAAYVQANAATIIAQSAFDTANLKFNTSGGTITGSTTINADMIVTGANVSLGNVANLHIYGGNTGQVLSTDNFGNLSFIDLPTSNTVTYTANTLTLTNGVYVSGSVTDIQVLNDGNYYDITDGSNTGPAWIITCTFDNVVSFNRVVANINYTASSGHTIYFQIYNNTTSVWDNIGSYTGASGYTQYALEVLGYGSYISGGTVQARLYHSNSGNISHTTLLDYFALEQSSQGAQGPRGPTGATGATGATGNGVATGGTTGQVLIKNSSTNYDTSWSSDLIYSYNTANSAITLGQSAYAQANAGYNQANSATTLGQSAYAQANAAYTQANSSTTLGQSAYSQANSAYTQANTATTIAQAAFDKANTGGTGSGITYTAAATPPSTPNVGDQWYYTVLDVLYEYTNDGTSNNWVDITGPTVSSNVVTYGSGSSSVANTNTYMFSGTSTGSNEIELFLNGINNSRLYIANNTTIKYDLDVVARRTNSANGNAGYSAKGVVVNNSNTVFDLGFVYEIVVARNDDSYNIDARANTTLKTLNIYATGNTAHTVKWIAIVTTTEVSQ